MPRGALHLSEHDRLRWSAPQLGPAFRSQFQKEPRYPFLPLVWLEGLPVSHEQTNLVVRDERTSHYNTQTCERWLKQVLTFVCKLLFSWIYTHIYCAELTLYSRWISLVYYSFKIFTVPVCYGCMLQLLGRHIGNILHEWIEGPLIELPGIPSRTFLKTDHPGTLNHRLCPPGLT